MMRPMATLPGLDLHLDVATARPGRSLEVALRAAILDGRLAPDTRLPATRSLAADLGISRNTVAAVYAQLTAEGWLEARVGSGTRVTNQARSATVVPAPGPPTSRRWIEMRGGFPDPTGFPRREWAAAVRSATLNAPAADLGYPDPAGVARLRTALAAYASRTRGVLAQPDRVVVGASFGELLVIICRALRKRGAKRVAVEEYGHASHRRLIASTGLDVVPAPVDGDGAVVTALESAKVAAVLLTPAHQFPVGVALSSQRRQWLIGWAERAGVLVIEDDYDGEFRYDRRTIGAVQALAPERVAYLGTASKAVAPAVGLAWAVPPAWILPEILDQRELAGGQPSALHQLALAGFVEKHEYDRSVRRLRTHYRSRRARLDAMVADHLPDCAVTGLAAGLQCVLRLAPGDDEGRIEREAARRGLRLQGLRSFRASGAAGDTGPALVIGYGGPMPGQYETALSILVDSIRATRD
jgi:GntR family transcriptional regulator / MocR family aminotransferase